MTGNEPNGVPKRFLLGYTKAAELRPKIFFNLASQGWDVFDVRGGLVDLVEHEKPCILLKLKPD